MPASIDVERLAMLCGGNHDLAAELLDLLIDDAETLIAGLDSAVAASDTATCFESAHALKGIAANVGAVELCAAAARLQSLTEEAGTNIGAALGEGLRAVEAAFERVRSARRAFEGAFASLAREEAS